MDDTLTNQLSRLLKDKDTPQDVVNEVLTSMATTQSRDMDKLIQSVNEQGDKIDTMARSINELTAEVRGIRASEQQFADVAETVKRYPSLTWLLSNRTRQTVTVIIAAFVVLSLWFVSGFREPLLAFLKLPVF